MFSTIVEKVEEEDKQAKEQDKQPPSPLTEFYYVLTLKGRETWPSEIGDWAYREGKLFDPGSTVAIVYLAENKNKKFYKIYCMYKHFQVFTLR